MKLIVNECKPDAYQVVTPDEKVFVVAIRPHLYIHGAPSGNIKVQIQDTNGLLIAESSTQTITSLKTLTYAHGYVKFDLDANLTDESSYRIVVVCGGGYAFSESAYVGVCRDWDNTKTTLGYTSNGAYTSPLDIEIWHRRI